LRRSVSNWTPSSNMPARPEAASVADRRVPHQVVTTAATSGPGPKTKASRSAPAGGSPRVSLSSTRPPREADAGPVDIRLIKLADSQDFRLCRLSLRFAGSDRRPPGKADVHTVRLLLSLCRQRE